MSERFELVDEYMRAKQAVEKATAWLDAVKLQLKEFGTFQEGDLFVDVSVVTRETISLTDIRKQRPDILVQLMELGFVKKSESERLTVRTKEVHEKDIRQHGV